MNKPALPHRGYSSLTVDRDRGVLWVCDISRSSSFINHDDLAEHIEAFLPRLHWASSLAINAVHGELIQWTGDGFIAWFPLEVERQLGHTCTRILEAIWHFSMFINVTQLCVDSPKPFRVRHGLTYEPDALVMTTTHRDGHISKTISGRKVVLAFRLSGIDADFPNVATQQRIVQSVSSRTRNLVNFRRWELSEDQLLRYFKGEKPGTTGLYISGRSKKRQSPVHAWKSRAERQIMKVENSRRSAELDSLFVRNFYPELVDSEGQAWCQQAVVDFVRFLREDMSGSLEKTLDAVRRFHPEEGDAKKDERPLAVPGSVKPNGR